ncbi:MAG TPA: 3-hydroxyacyl-CoA dehydrogenase NAD-binding domain-containing protein, partial [Frankiaceae bacterium]|nr:3-hydroxyacyl-CoA dehydrogenase NAD-binding domain-containing protein [Frankiaceae bacterium]
MARQFGKVGVVGVGVRGAGIVEVLARSGLEVIGIEQDDASIERAQRHLEQSLDGAVTAGVLTDEQRQESLGRISLRRGLTELAGCDLVIEAVPEQLARKLEIFSQLDEVLDAEAVLASNTSTLSVTELAATTRRAGRVLGLRWYSAVPGATLVEITKTVLTDPAVLTEVTAFIEGLGRSIVVVGDRPGHIVDSLLFPYLNNAIGMLEAKYATREDIDAAMRFGCGYPIGPLALLDLIGLDAAFEILDTLHARTGDHLHAPAPMLKQLVTAGMLGVKSGRGFYSYTAPGSAEIADVGAQSGPAIELAREVTQVGVIGTGTMASGIVEVCAKSGYDVVFRARSDDKVAAVRKKIEGSLDKQVQRGRLAEDARNAALSHITGSTELSDLANCDLIIEAVVEEIGVKRELFAELDKVCKPGAVLATTTSSLPVIECAMATTRPEDVVGMHWFNPAPAMKLVEVVPTVLTSEDVTATVRAVSLKCRKHPVICGDRAGFIVNALLFPFLNDAVRLFADSYASMDEIDLALKTACKHPMGPFELVDVVG